MMHNHEHNTRKNVVVFTVRCSVSGKLFGVRLEQLIGDQWIADWAFAIREDAAKREGYDKGIVKGTFNFSDSYPGCPYCKSTSIAGCSCSVLSCIETGAKAFTCPSCRQYSLLTVALKEIHAGIDR